MYLFMVLSIYLCIYLWFCLMLHRLSYETMVLSLWRVKPWCFPLPSSQTWGFCQAFGLNISENPGLIARGSTGLGTSGAGNSQLCLKLTRPSRRYLKLGSLLIWALLKKPSCTAYRSISYSALLAISQTRFKQWDTISTASRWLWIKNPFPARSIQIFIPPKHGGSRGSQVLTLFWSIPDDSIVFFVGCSPRVREFTTCCAICVRLQIGYVWLCTLKIQWFSVPSGELT